jgi:cyanophycinase
VPWFSSKNSFQGLDFMMRLQLHETLGWWNSRTFCQIALFLVFIGGVAGMPQATFCAESPIDPESQPHLVSKGTLFICGGGVLSWKLIDRFVELSGGKDARIVIISSASYYADHDIQNRLSGWYDRLGDNCFTSLDILHTRSREEADTAEFSRILDSATAIWFIGGNQNWVSQVYLGTKTEERMHALLARGGVIGGSSAGAAIMSRCMIADGKTEPILSTGFGFIPGAIIDQHFRKRNRFDRLKRAIEMRPGLVGIGIDEGTALIVRGRDLEVMGESDVSICLAQSAHRTERMEYLKPGDRADLVTWRRAAFSRAGLMLAEHHEQPQTPDVQNGTLVIVGGGPTPQEAVDTFLAAAGGKESHIVVVSNALGETPPERDAVCGWLSAAGANNVHLLHTETGEDLSNPNIVSLLKEARGVWFTGGRQWRLVDAFLDTHIVDLFHDVLRRGGVIGGTSAGATIQGQYLVRGNPLNNQEVSTEGYERGFGFLPGVAIDQHFTQRERLDDMANLKKVHPELIGLGVDESTALIVRGSTMHVVGQHNVTVFDRKTNSQSESPEFAVLKSGERYDLRHHRRMETAADDIALPTK